MEVWSLTTIYDEGTTSLYKSEISAYRALAQLMFGEEAEEPDDARLAYLLSNISGSGDRLTNSRRTKEAFAHELAAIGWKAFVELQYVHD